MTAMEHSNGNPNIVDETYLPSNAQQDEGYAPATRGVHADDAMHAYTDVAPAMHVSTTFRYPRDPAKLVTVHEQDFTKGQPGGVVPGDSHVYSRATAPNTSRLEMILSSILGKPCLTYSSGLSAFHALLVYLHPKVVAIGAGYHGCHGVLGIYQKLTGCKIVDLLDEKSWDDSNGSWSLGKGDVVHLETPLNPTGKAFDIQRFAEMAHRRGAVLTVDATFAPPPLSDPFKQGADYVMHSGTKYIGGHSDMLCGVIALRDDKQGWEKDYWSMFGERIHLGAVMGSLEGWLGVRSIRTLDLRVRRQSENAGKLVQFIHQSITGADTSDMASPVRQVLSDIEHASLQEDDMPWLTKQMPNGFGPVFAVSAKSAELAKGFASKLNLFHHATSLGGVESLVEWRCMSDAEVADTLLRISVGIENWEDLRDDIVQTCKELIHA